MGHAHTNASVLAYCPDYRESAASAAAYGKASGVLYSDVDRMVALGGAMIEHNVNEEWTNEGVQGIGHGFETDQEFYSWTSQLSIGDVPVDTQLLGQILLATLGSLNTTTPTGGTDSRDHLFKFMTLSSSLQLPSLCFVGQEHPSVDPKLFTGFCGSALSLKGGRNQFVVMNATLIGSGHYTEVGSFSTPSLSAIAKLRDSVATCSIGTVGAPTAVTANVISWTLNINTNLLTGADGYYANGNNGLLVDDTPASGMIRSQLRIGQPTVTLSLVLQMTDDSIRTVQEGNTVQEVLITAQGDEIEEGFNDALTIQAKGGRVRNRKVGDAEGIRTVEFDVRLSWPTSGLYADFLAITLRNSTDEYGSLKS